MAFKIEMGVKVRDIINGFEGVVTGRAEYVTGCNQYIVCPTGLDKDGKMRDSSWFDEGRLEVVSKPPRKVATMVAEARPQFGGPRSDAPRGKR